MEPGRSRQARAAAEAALVRVVHHYGGVPDFVLLGGLVPDLLCVMSGFTHAGTTDIDVQVNLEVHSGSRNAPRLERALYAAGFSAETSRVWRWVSAGPAGAVKFELLADLDDAPAEAEILFEGCSELGAVNLRGTGYAARDVHETTLLADVNGTEVAVKLHTTGLAGYLLAKTHAARSRRAPKDLYDIVFVLLHHGPGGPSSAVEAIRRVFPGEPLASTRTAVEEVAAAANFASPGDTGCVVYADQMLVDHPDLDWDQLAADAVAAIAIYRSLLTG